MTYGRPRKPAELTEPKRTVSMQFADRIIDAADRVAQEEHLSRTEMTRRLWLWACQASQSERAAILREAS